MNGSVGSGLNHGSRIISETEDVLGSVNTALRCLKTVRTDQLMVSSLPSI